MKKLMLMLLLAGSIQAIYAQTTEKRCESGNLSESI